MLLKKKKGMKAGRQGKAFVSWMKGFEMQHNLMQYLKEEKLLKKIKT